MRKGRLLVIGLAVALVAAVVIAVVPTLNRHNEFVRSGNQMHAVLFVAALEWPSEHDGSLPTNFVSMSNELITPKLLVCPADHSRHPAASWSSFSAEHCSYEILAPGLRKGDTNSVFLRCRIHGLTGYADDRLLDTSGRLVTKRLW